MKKLFTLIASALFAVGASAETKTTTYAVQVGETHTAGDVVDVKDGDDVVATLTFGFAGGANFSAGKSNSANSSLGFVAYTEGNGEDGKPDGGTTYIINPKHDGEIEVGVVLNANKNFYVLEDEVALSSYNGITEDAKKQGSYKFNVKAGKEYKVYATGTKLGFYGIVYTYDPSTSADQGDAGGSDDNTGSGDSNTDDSDNNGSDDGNGNTGDNEGDNAGGSEGEFFARWDFTQWSAETIAALKADAAAGEDTGWSDLEAEDKRNDTYEASKDNCFWAADESVANEDGYLTANGVLLTELEGLKFMFFNRNLAIAVNYPKTSLGEYKEGGAYLWLGGKEKNYFIIPNVPGNAVIKMGVESHKPTEARGVELYISNNGERGTKLDGPSAPTVYADQEFKVPASEEPVDVIVYNTNGCHLYYIEVVEGTDDNTGEEDGNGEGEGDTTGIQQVAAKSGNSVIINLAGQKVDSSYKGIVVKDGKKYVQK